MLKKDQKTSHHFRESRQKLFEDHIGKEKKSRGKSTELNTVNKISEKKGQASVGFANSSKAWIALGVARTKCSGFHEDIRKGLSWELGEVWKQSQKHLKQLPSSRALLPARGEAAAASSTVTTARGVQRERWTLRNPKYSNKLLKKQWISFLIAFDRL